MLSGTRGTTEVDVAMFLTVCGVRGRERKRLLAVCQDQGVPGWLQEYGDRLPKQLVTLVDHEDKAHGIPISISSCPLACMRRSARQRRSSLLPDRLNCTTSGSEPPIPFLPGSWRVASAEELREIFDEDPELYDRARPDYPDALFHDLSELTEIGPGARVAEIGPGTGQATATLAAGGAHVVAVELGAALAAALQRKLTGVPVEVVVCAFEDWQLPSEPFDTLVAFTAWHWLDPAVRAAKAGAALRPGGALATISTTHVLGGTEEFFADVQDCYERWDPSTPPGLRLAAADAVPPAVDEIDDSELFLPAVRRRYVPPGRRLLLARLPRVAWHLLRAPGLGARAETKPACLHW